MYTKPEMTFYDREQELNLIRKILPVKGTSLIIVKGIRRIGKTSLVLKALEGKKFVSLFIPKDKTVGLFLEENAVELHLPQFTSLIDFLRYIFEHNEYVFIDEFQNFYSLEKSAYSDVQKLFEEAKRKEYKVCLLVTGSSYSLIKKIFYDYAKALYGRKDIEITLEELPLAAVCTWLTDIGIKDMEEQIKYWSICGGMPKLYDLISKTSPTNFNEFLINWLEQGKSIVDEGNSILISEFGGAYKTYYTIMEAVAGGKAKLAEIASLFSNDRIAANRYLDLMRKEYNLVAKITPIFDDIRRSRQGIYTIKYNFLWFWFAFVKRYEAYYEQDRVSELLELVQQNINTFIGRQFEQFCLRLLHHTNPFPFSCNRIGRQWGKIISAPKEKNQYEIDICGVNEAAKKMLIGECKWQENVDAEKLLAELQHKASYVQWNNQDRTEYYVIFAKSFQRKIKAEKVYLFDLKDIQKMVKKDAKNNKH